MNKKELEKYIAEGYTQRKIALAESTSHSNVRYWLKKYHLRTLHRPGRNSQNVNGKCDVCGKAVKRRFLCPGCCTKVRRFRTKTRAVELLGGKCKDCGWSGHLAGYDFHHLHGKDFSIGQVANKSWEIVKQELEKCILLCARCHRIRHSNMDGPKFLVAVGKYRGRELN